MARLNTRHAGFTLLELLLVVGIMAIIGGALLTAVGGSGKGSVRGNAQIRAVQLEMEQIRQALLRYEADNFNWPASVASASPADAGFLFEQPVSASDWSADYRTGWHGPYINGGDSGLVDIGSSLISTGAGDPLANNPPGSASLQMVRAIPDPFAITADQVGGTVRRAQACDSDHFEEKTTAYETTDQCLLDWWPLGLKSSYAKPATPPDWPASPTPYKKYGRPYLLFDLAEKGRARIVSMGPNGRYDGVNDTHPCVPPDNTDDLVLCLN